MFYAGLHPDKFYLCLHNQHQPFPIHSLFPFFITIKSISLLIFSLLLLSLFFSPPSLQNKTFGETIKILKNSGPSKIDTSGFLFLLFCNLSCFFNLPFLAFSLGVRIDAIEYPLNEWRSFLDAANAKSKAQFVAPHGAPTSTATKGMDLVTPQSGSTTAANTSSSNSVEAEIEPVEEMATEGPVIQLLLANRGGKLGLRVVGGLGTSHGALLVSGVASNSRSERAGLRVGDRILSLQGLGMMRAIEDTFADALEDAFDDSEESVVLEVQRIDDRQWKALSTLKEAERDGFVRAISLPLIRENGSHPVLPATKGPVHELVVQKSKGERLGMRVVGGVDTTLGGVFVAAVAPDGVADHAGFKVYFDLLMQICALKRVYIYIFTFT